MEPSGVLKKGHLCHPKDQAGIVQKRAASMITPANYEDEALLAECDWVVEAVVERLDIKQRVFQWVADNRKPGSIVSSQHQASRWQL